MSIVAYSGLPGSGKSYGVVENVIIPALNAGRHIITNIPLSLGRMADDFPKGKITTFTNSEASEQDSPFFDMERHPSGVIWVIDEAWRFWKSGAKSVNMPQEEKEFFTEHRHNVGPDGRTNEIVLVTQDLSQLASFVRQLVEETYRAVKLTAIGSNTKYRIDVYMGAAVGQKPGKPMRQLYGSYKKEVYQYYKSHTRNKTDFAAGMEEKADDRANVLKHPLIKLGIPLCILIAIVAVYQVKGYFDVEASEQNEASPDSLANAVTLDEVPYPEEARRSRSQTNQHQSRFELHPEWLPLSDNWRILGTFNDLIVLYSERGIRRIHSRNCGKFKKTGEDFCVIDGQLVTRFSAEKPGDKSYRQGERFTPSSGTDS
jgi:zona occludens toxin